MKSKTILSALTGILFVSVLTVGAFSIAPAVHAQEWDGGYDFGSDIGSGCCGDTGSYTESIDYPTDQGSYTESIDYPEYEYDNSGYSNGGYTSGGYGYTTGGYSYNTPVYYPTPTNNTPTNTNVNTNTCTNNSCNNDDHSVVNITNPAPVFNNVIANYGGTSVNQQQYCATGYLGTYPNCYRAPVVYQQPVVAYAATPYVSLSQVPYTGLDLGFWGTIAYWGAMIIFALVVAYLLAIKRVQNTIALKFKNFLFGTTETEEVVVTTHAPAQVQVVHTAPVVSESSEDVIDSFIMSQINRPRHA